MERAEGARTPVATVRSTFMHRTGMTHDICTQSRHMYLVNVSSNAHQTRTAK